MLEGIKPVVFINNKLFRIIRDNRYYSLINILSTLKRGYFLFCSAAKKFMLPNIPPRRRKKAAVNLNSHLPILFVVLAFLSNTSLFSRAFNKIEIIL